MLRLNFASPVAGISSPKKPGGRPKVAARPRMRIVGQGIDTAVLTFLAPVPGPVIAALEPLKREAQERRDHGDNSPVTYDLGGRPWRVAAGSSAPWSFALERDKEMTLSVAGRPLLSDGTPTVRAEIRSDYLWAKGYREAIADAQALARALLFDPDDILERVARLDLCVDFQGWRPRLHSDQVRRFRTHAQDSFQSWGMPGRVHQVDWGYGSPIAARVYNKSKEIVKSKKTWFFAVWARFADAYDGRDARGTAWVGYDPSEPVWRAEVQLRGEGLEELGVRVDWTNNVEPNLDRIWRYMFGDPRWEPDEESEEERLLRRLLNRIRRHRKKLGEATGLDVTWAAELKERIAANTGGVVPGAWLSLRAPSSDPNTRRHPIDARWRVLQAVTWVDPSNARATREDQLGAHLDNLRAQAAGVLSSIAALRGITPPLLAADPRENLATLELALGEFISLQATHDKTERRPFAMRVGEKAALRPRLADVGDHASRAERWRKTSRLMKASRSADEERLEMRVRLEDVPHV